MNSSLADLGSSNRCLFIDKWARFFGSWYQRPELHRWTWYSNAGGVAKEIDHILVSTRWRILQNCRAYRSAEFFGTDLRLVVATLKLHVKSRRIARGNHTMFHLEKLKDLTCAHEYAVAVSNRFDVLGALGDPVDLWDTLKRETLQAAKECIGERPRSRRGFVSTETLEKIKESRAARLAGNRDQHRALSRRTRTLLRRDKERYVRSLAEDVEGHLNANDLRPAYRALKKLRSKSPSRASAIRTADGRLVSDMDGQMARWAEYFGQLFTVDPPTEQLHTTGLQAVDADPPIDETAPSLDEVREAVAKLKGGKAAGVCNISAELLKAGVIFAESLEVMVMALEALHEEAKPLGLEVSWLKTKVQVFGDLLDEAVQCQAVNPSVKKKFISNGGHLNVIPRQNDDGTSFQHSLLGVASKVEAYEGEKAVLECITDDEEPLLEWSRIDESPIPKNTIRMGQGSLVFPSLTEEDTGVYNCTAVSKKSWDPISTNMAPQQPSRSCTCGPDAELTGKELNTLEILVKYCLQVYFKLYYDIKVHHRLEDGPKPSSRKLRVMRSQPKKVQTAVTFYVRTGAWFAHSECVLLSLMAGSE
ncbi:hypothetical protein GWK47_013555 [Chionoecetes opilio]|uniref:Ig-like domain-containing protein n=1 Tax=Chionoecetes opilio TaxID=41210 RepID=A0A8J5C179_CHIOP|nr:hypothetical protein GWK47_013555 [Chionoecetes opilio]